MRFTALRTLAILVMCGASPFASAQRRAPSAPPAQHGAVQERLVPNYTPLYDVQALSAKDEGKVTFSARSELVQVPVVVSDSAGVHIPGLKKEDFSIFENGKEQTVAIFEEIHADKTPIQKPAVGLTETSNVLSGAHQPRQITIIVLDAINTPFLDQSYARGQVVKYLSENYQGEGPTSLVSLDYKGLHLLHDFTSDPNELVQSLHKVTGMLPQLDERDTAALALAQYPASLQNVLRFVQSDSVIATARESDAIEATLDCFLHLAQSVAGVPGRKSLIWLTGGFPFVMTDASSVPGYGLSPKYERTMQMMSDANIAVYPVDARGLVSYGFSGATRPGVRRGPTTRAAGNAARSSLEQDIRVNLDQFASMTGGRAFYNSNDLTKGFKQAAEDGESFYVIGYYLNRKNTDSGWRKLKVQVHRENVHVLARSGFLVTPVTADTIASRPFDMLAALHSPLNATGLPVALRWTGTVQSGEKRKVSFLLGSAPDQVNVDSARNNHLSVDVAVLVQKKTGEDALQFARTVNSDLQADKVEQLAKLGFGYPGQLEIGPGDYMVRFVMRDNTTGRVGSVSAPLEIK